MRHFIGSYNILWKKRTISVETLIFTTSLEIHFDGNSFLELIPGEDTFTEVI